MSPQKCFKESHRPIKVQPEWGWGTAIRQAGAVIFVRAKITPQESTKPFPAPPKIHPMNTKVNAGQTGLSISFHPHGTWWGCWGCSVQDFDDPSKISDESTFPPSLSIPVCCFHTLHGAQESRSKEGDEERREAAIFWEIKQRGKGNCLFRQNRPGKIHFVIHAGREVLWDGAAPGRGWLCPLFWESPLQCPRLSCASLCPLWWVGLCSLSKSAAPVNSWLIPFPQTVSHIKNESALEWHLFLITHFTIKKPVCCQAVVCHLLIHLRMLDGICIIDWKVLSSTGIRNVSTAQILLCYVQLRLWQNWSQF